jgi:outer membrane biosynthesis protein TonB
MAAPPSAPTLGGLPDVGGGLSGLGQQLADAFGSLLGSVDGASAEPPAIDQPDKNGNVDGTSDDNPKGDGEPVDPAAEGPVDPAADKPAEEPVVEPADTCERTAMPAAVEPPTEPAPTPVPEPPPPESVAPLGAEASAETPCEIAADELPQVGK